MEQRIVYFITDASILYSYKGKKENFSTGHEQIRPMWHKTVSEEDNNYEKKEDNSDLFLLTFAGAM